MLDNTLSQENLEIEANRAGLTVEQFLEQNPTIKVDVPAVESTKEKTDDKQPKGFASSMMASFDGTSLMKTVQTDYELEGGDYENFEVNSESVIPVEKQQAILNLFQDTRHSNHTRKNITEELAKSELTIILEGSGASVKEAGAYGWESFGNGISITNRHGVTKRFTLSGFKANESGPDIVDFLNQDQEQSDEYKKEAKILAEVISPYFTEDMMKKLTNSKFLSQLNDPKEVLKQIKSDFNTNEDGNKDIRNDQIAKLMAIPLGVKEILNNNEEGEGNEFRLPTEEELAYAEEYDMLKNEIRNAQEGRFKSMSDSDIDRIIKETFAAKVDVLKKQKLKRLSSEFLVSLKNGDFKDENGNDLKNEKDFFANYERQLIQTLGKDEAAVATLNMEMLSLVKANAGENQITQKRRQLDNAIEVLNENGNEYVAVFDIENGTMVRKPKSADDFYGEGNVNVETDINEAEASIKEDYANSKSTLSLYEYSQMDFYKNAKEISEFEQYLETVVKIGTGTSKVDPTGRGRSVVGFFPHEQRDVKLKDILGYDQNFSGSYDLGWETMRFVGQVPKGGGSTPEDRIKNVDEESTGWGLKPVTGHEYFKQYILDARSQYKDLQIRQEALKKIYLMNQDGTSISKKKVPLLGIFSQQSGKNALNSLTQGFGDDVWGDITGRVGTNVEVIDEYVNTLNEIGVPVSPQLENYADRSFGEQVSEGVSSSVGILLEFAVANKVVAAARTVKLFKNAKSLNNILSSSKATRYRNVKTGKLWTQAQINAKVGTSKVFKTEAAWASFHAGKSGAFVKAGPNLMKSFGAKITEGLIEGIKFGGLPSSSGDRLGAFATGFGFGLGGQFLAPVLGTINAGKLTAKGWSPTNKIQGFVINQAPRLDKAYQLGFKSPLSFAVGSELGELSLAMTDDFLGYEETQTFLDEHYSDWSKTSQRFVVNAAIGASFGLTHKANYKLPETMSQMNSSLKEAVNKNFGRAKKYWVTDKDGKRRSFSRKVWDNLSLKEKAQYTVKSKPGDRKILEKYMGGKKYEEFQKNLDVAEHLRYEINKANDVLDLYDPILAPFKLEQLYKNQNKHYVKEGARIETKRETNESEYFKKHPDAKARVEYLDSKGNEHGSFKPGVTKKVKQTFNVDKIEPGVAPHELGHSGMSILFGTNARLKGSFMKKLHRISKELTINEAGETLADLMKQENGKWDLKGRSWENARISEWEMFSYMAELLAKPENLRKLQTSKTFEKLDGLIKTEIGGPNNQNYNFKTYKDIVRFFGDYIQTINKGSSSLESLKHLDVVIDKAKTSETKDLRESFKENNVEFDIPLKSRNLASEKASLLKENKDLLEKRPEGYREKNKEISSKIKNINKLMETSKINEESIGKYKEIEVLEKEKGSNESTSLRKSKAFEQIRENNQGILNDFVNRNYKEVPGSSLTKSEFKKYVENNELLKIINSYDVNTKVPFGAYLKQNLSKRLGNILRALGVDMNKTLVTQSRDAEGFKEVEFAGEDGGVKELPGEAKGIELVYELPIAQKTIDAIIKKMSSLDVANIDYKTLKDLMPSNTKEMFGKTNLEKAKFIADNWKTIYDLLPQNTSEVSGKATGIENSILKDFYVKGGRVKMVKTGDAAGNPIQEKIKMSKQEFLKKLGITQKLDGSVDISNMNRNIKTSTIPSIVNQTGKAITNQIVRAEIKRDGKEGWQNLVNKIGSGKSEALQSRTLENVKLTADLQVFYNEVKSKSFETRLKQNLKFYDTQVKAVKATLIHQFKDYKLNNKNNDFGISDKQLRNIGKEMNDTFTYKKIEASDIVSKTIKSIESPNSLEAIDVKAGLKVTNSRFKGEADLVDRLDVSRFVAEGLTAKSGEGVYEARLARGESGGKGVGQFDSIGDLFLGLFNSKNRQSMFESINDANMQSHADIKHPDGKKYKGKRSDAATNKKAVFKDIVSKNSKEWNEKNLEELFQYGEESKVVLTDAIEILRNGYAGKKATKDKAAIEATLTNQQVRAWIEMHANGMSGLIKAAGSFALVPNMTPGEMFKKYGKDASNYVLEHTTPAQTIKARIYDYIINGTSAKKSLMENAIKDYHTTLIPEKFDAMVNKTLKTELPSWHIEGVHDPVASRYYESNHPSDFTFGLRAFEGRYKNRVYDHNPNMSAEQKIKKAQQLKSFNASLFPKNLRKGTDNTLNSKDLNNLQHIDKALELGRLKAKKKRGMSTFDFDETVGVSENYVFATKGGKKKKISSAEWPFVGETLAKEGWKMDFTDFNRVTKGKPGPLMQKMKNQIKKFGPENVFILTARAPESQKAIHDYLKSEGIEIPLKNVTGLGNSTGEAKALWMLEKFAEGYNDMYFVDDAMPNVKAVKDVLSQLDIKSKVQQALQAVDLSKNFNKIIEEVTGTKSYKEFSLAKGQALGAKKGKYKFFGTPGSEDFAGLVTYSFAGKGKKGQAHKKFFNDKLHVPYNRAWNNIHKKKQSISNDYKELRKNFPEEFGMLNRKIDGVYSIDQAVRVHLWNKAGFEVPGLSKADLKTLTDFVRKDPGFLAFSEKLSKISKLKEGWIKPKEYWLAENITSDLNNVVDRIYRKEAMGKFLENREAIFGKWKGGSLEGVNMNKIEALYGSKHRLALENMLWRMENFTNRSYGTDATTGKWMNWVNNASSAIMFFNQKSAMLQTISSVNYLNGRQNNPIQAGKAFANQPQYWKDFMYIMNSDMLVQRRGGLKINVEAAEIVERVGGGKNTAGRALSVLLEKGFIPTKYADSFAIASGGATYYRNTVKMYKKQGFSIKKAEAKAWEDFSLLTEKTQQSSRPDMISQQQASGLGRPILSFANTPMQMFRRHKRRLQDIGNRRGNIIENVLSSVYYGAVQTMIFSYLSNAMFATDEESILTKDIEFADKQKQRYTQTVVDSYLRGMGVGGASLSAVKNSILTLANESEKDRPQYRKAVVDLLNVSPPIGSKVRKLESAADKYTFKKSKDKIKNSSLLSLENPAVYANAQIISALTNFPADNVVKKAINISDAMNGDFENWERIALMSGYNKWALGFRDDEMIGPKLPSLPSMPKAPKLPNIK
tara:strand:+ start:2916 stop:12068 length:9153 start_codon:yes stop_codon:yes gene_type:complete